jgi:hypothetical protein
MQPTFKKIVNSKNLMKAASLSKVSRDLYSSNPSNKPLKQMDISSPEVLNFLEQLHINQVRYLLVGGMATTFHGYIRTTQDLDLWIDDSPDNKDRLIMVLKLVNVPGAENYRTVPMIAGWSAITIGAEGFVADFVLSMKAFSSKDFGSCYLRAKKGEFQGVPITVIHLNDLIKEKESTGRHKDLDDLENLQRIRKDLDNDV